jgi:hypothetical protein
MDHYGDVVISNGQCIKNLQVISKMKKVLYNFIGLVFLLATLFGCSTSKLSSKGKKLTDSLTEGALIGVRNQLANPATKKVVIHLLDSLIDALDTSLEPKITTIENRVLSQKIIRWTDSLLNVITGQKLQNNVGGLIDAATGQKLRDNVAALIEAATGKKLNDNMKDLQATLIGKTRGDILQIKDGFQGLLQYILSDSTNYKIGLLRDQLLGPKTDTAITHLVDDASKKLLANVKKADNDNSDIITRHAVLILVVVGAIALIIIFFIWRSRRKYLQMVTLLTKHINNIPNKDIYDHVTAGIQEDAINAGLEPSLRQILGANGLLSTETWAPKKTISKDGRDELA